MDKDPFDLVGTLVERKYRIERVVAEGGFGVVYRALHIALSTPVAIKVLRPLQNVDQEKWNEHLAAFLDEAKTLARLHHPAIVGVLDAGVTQPKDTLLAWMALEWIEGTTLADALLERAGAGGRPPDEVLALLRPVLEAIAAAHDVGVVHRDLKPSNIMIARDGAVRVLDFGVAKVMDEESSDVVSGTTETRTEDRAFTRASAAPEQLSGTRTGPWTDVYAFGLLLTELLTDRQPFEGCDPHEHLRRAFDPKRPTPAQLGMDVGEWEPVLAQALAVRPGDRHRNARALLEALEAALPRAAHVRLADHAPESAVPSQGTDKTTTPASLDGARSRRRSPRVALAAAGLLVAAGLSTALVAKGPRKVPAASPAPACAHNRDCASDAATPMRCDRGSGKCVSLASEDCVVRAEPADLANDDTVYVGSLFPTTGALGASYGLDNDRAVELARRDFAQVMGPLAARGELRPIAVVSCDSVNDPRRAATHLVTAVRAPAVIGFENGTEAIDLSNASFVPAGALVLNATSSNPLVADIPQPTSGPRLVYSTTYSLRDVAAAMAQLVPSVLEPILRRDGAARTRVAFVRLRNAAGAAFADALFARIRFNGKDALANGPDYREITYDASASENGPELAQVADDLVAFRPGIVLYTGGAEFVRGAIAPLEARWPAAVRPRPFYVNGAHMNEAVYSVIGSDESRRRRFLGFTSLSDTANNARFVVHYNETFPEAPLTRTRSSNSAYDAFYLVALASYAVPRTDAITGARLAEALARLGPPGRHVDVGLAGIFEAYNVLRAGGQVDLDGATGSLDFDLRRGEAPFDQDVLCAGHNDAQHAGGDPSGLTYKRGALAGELRCEN